MRVNGQIFTVVGVAPKGFTGTTLGRNPTSMSPRLQAPLTPNWNGTDRWNDYWLYLFGRPKPGLSRTQAESLERRLRRTGGRASQDAAVLLRQKRSTASCDSRLKFEDGSQGKSGIATAAARRSSS